MTAVDRRISEGSRIEITVRQVGGEHVRSVRCAPKEDGPGTGFVFGAQTPHEQEGAQPEAVQDLRKLGDVAERVGHIAFLHGSAERLRDAGAGLKIPDDGFRADEEQVGRDIPRSADQASGTDQGFQPRPVFGTDRQVIFKENGLSVKREGMELRAGFQKVEQTVDQAHQMEAECGEGEIPRSVPMGMGDDDGGFMGGGFHSER